MDEKQLQEMIDEVTRGKVFDRSQMQQIREGFKNGLSMEQIQVYADSKFEWGQMGQIRWGFEHDLSVEQVKIYAKPEFNGYQMSEIRNGFEDGLTIEQIQVYANPKFDADYGCNTQMDEIRLGFRHGLTMEQVQMYADSKFGWHQMEKMREEAETHLSEIITHYKGELGEFDYNRSDFVLLHDKDGKDYLQYNEHIYNTTLILPSGLTNTRNMFKRCTLPNGFTLRNFDTRSVVDMSYMFYGCNAPDNFVFNDKFVINDDCIVKNMFEDSNIDDLSPLLSPLERPDLETDGEEL